MYSSIGVRNWERWERRFTSAISFSEIIVGVKVPPKNALMDKFGNNIVKDQSFHLVYPNICIKYRLYEN